MMIIMTMVMFTIMRNQEEITSINDCSSKAIAMTMIVVNYIVSDADSIMQVK